MAKSRKTFQRLGFKEQQRQEVSAQRKVYEAIEAYKKIAEDSKAKEETEVIDEEIVKQDVADS